MAAEKKTATPSPAAREGGRAEQASGPKQQRAVRTRLQVLDAAAEAFAARGYPSVTIMDVAELAGMTKGAVYFHFANKEALAQEVAAKFYERLGVVVESVRQDGLSPLDEVSELLMRTAQAFREDVVVQAGARLQIEYALIGADLPAPFEGYTEALCASFRRARADGLLAPGANPEVLSRVLAAAFFGAQHISWIQRGRADLGVRVQELLSTLLPRVEVLP
ncbi:ScbR family autoregulator-binding transcription factor [Streptomyces sp. NPDC048438]|uniref:ScbR family autoregulator-binding transcription factor n=1 Tax=Streptomyces sp. NPDC048438 TaxID=3365551 RepID=UPI00371ADB1E